MSYYRFEIKLPLKYQLLSVVIPVLVVLRKFPNGSAWVVHDAIVGQSTNHINRVHRVNYILQFNFETVKPNALKCCKSTKFIGIVVNR